MLIVVIGGTVVLQSSQGLAPPKLIYLAFAVGAFAFSCRAVWNLRDRRVIFGAARPWLVASLLLLGLIGLSLPVAIVHGTPISTWLRDAATYGLCAAAPIFALDAATSMRWRLVFGVTVILGILGTLSFATYWIAYRNIAILPLDRFVLPTSSLPMVLLTVSLATAILDRRRALLWVILGGFALSAFLVTGTRSNLLMFVAFPVVVVLAGRALAFRSIGASVAVCLVAAALAFVVQAGFERSAQEAQSANPSPTVSSPSLTVGSPGASATAPGSSGVTPAPGGPTPPGVIATPRPTANPNATIIERLQAFLASPGNDGSVRERMIQYQVAFDLFGRNPVLGTGLGYSFVWTRLDGSTYQDFTADTPLVFPAKLGILGIAWLLLLAIVWIGFVRKLRRMAGITIVGLAMASWAVLIVTFSWASFMIEDKGFSLALTLMLTLGFMELEQAAQARRTAPNGPPADLMVG